MNFDFEPKSISADLEEVLDKAHKIVQKVPNVSTIMIRNNYDQIAPLNLWFYDKKYRIVDLYENHQHIRARYYGSILLTPLVTTENVDMGELRNFRDILSTYQPFYPETFYQVWEFLQLNLQPKLLNSPSTFLHIGREHTLGTMESIMLHQERYNHNYLQNQ